MKLEQVQIIGVQQPEALLQVGFHPLPVPLHAFGGQDQVLPGQIFKGPADLLFAVQVNVGRIEQGDPRSRARRSTRMASSRVRRMMGIQPKPTSETSKPVLPKVR